MPGLSMHIYFSRLFAIGSLAAMSVGVCHAAETVISCGEKYADGSATFTCYFQNEGDAGMAEYGMPKSAKNWTPDRIAAVVRALETWDNIIANTPGRTLKVGLCWFDKMPERALAGGAATGFSYDPVPGLTKGTLITENVWKRGLTKVSGKYDIIICCNPRYYDSFYYGADASGLPPRQHDFQSLLLHELGHAFGFYTMASLGGKFHTVSQINPQTGAKWSATVYTAYDELMTTAKGPVVNQQTKTAQLTLGERITLKGSNLCIFNPVTYQSGNSYHHVSHGTGKEAHDMDLVMSYTLGPGVARRNLSIEEIKLMRAMGWKTSAAEQKK